MERRLGHNTPEPATPHRVLAAINGAATLVLGSHVQPGTAAQPASAGLILSDGQGGRALLTVAQLATAAVPPTCLILGCDGSRATVGDERTGLATGLLWAGANTIITSTWPTLEDRHTARADTALTDSVARLGPHNGLGSGSAPKLASWRDDPTRADASPYRWAGMIVCGRGSPSGRRTA